MTDAEFIVAAEKLNQIVMLDTDTGPDDPVANTRRLSKALCDALERLESLVEAK